MLYLFIYFTPILCIYQTISLNNTPILVNIETQDRTLIYSYNDVYHISDIQDFLTNQLNYTKLQNAYDRSDRDKKICILYDTSERGLGYYYEAELARSRISQELYPFFYYKFNVTAQNINETISTLVAENFSVIIGTSASHTLIFMVYPLYPNVTFSSIIAIDISKIPPRNNIIAYSIPLYTQQYETGVLSGSMTKSKKVCFITPFKGFTSTNQVNYHYLGIYSVCPECELYIYILNTYSNLSLELEAVQKCHQSGADVVAYQTNDPIIVEYASNNNISSIGYSYDMRISYGESVLSSIVINWYYILYDILKLARMSRDTMVIREPLQNDVILAPFSLNVDYDTQQKINILLYDLQNISLDTVVEGSCSKLDCSVFTKNDYINSPNVKSEVVVLYPKSQISIFVSFDQGGTIVLFILGLLIALYLLFNIISILFFRNSDAIIKRKIFFLLCQNLGCIILLVSVFEMIGYPTPVSCYLQLIFLLLGFDLFYLPFLVKALRIYILYKVDLTNTINLPDWKLGIVIVCFLIIDGVFLIVWFTVYPIFVKIDLFNNTPDADYYYISCDISKGFLIALFVYKTVLSAIVWLITDLTSQIGMRLSDKIKRKKLRKITDALEIKFGITFTFILLIIVLMVLLVIDTNPMNNFVCISISIYLAILAPMIQIIYRIFQDLFYSTPEINKENPSTK